MLRELIETFRKPSAETIARRELEDARRGLLQAETGRDYYASMVAYHQTRIVRLEASLQEREIGRIRDRIISNAAQPFEFSKQD